jgi:hypothetical protein
MAASVNALETASADGDYGAEFTVSQGGAAVYEVPIEVIPGPGGLQPAISVNYYSQKGLGLLGRGWRLSATETITRCQPVGQATDAPDYDDDDTFCLNGDELVEIETDIYRKKFDDGSLVEQDSDTSFSVYLENGTVKTFDQVLYTDDESAVKVWYLGNVTNLGGAEYDLSYSFDQDNGEALLSDITYGAHSVSFAYEDRTDVRYGYDHGGAKFSRTQLLSSITTYSDGESVATYSFFYDYNSRIDQSYLTDIQKCAGSLCLDALSFTWDAPSEDEDDWYESSVTESIDSDYEDVHAFADIDGNGSFDVIGTEIDDGNVEIRAFKSSVSDSISISSVMTDLGVDVSSFTEGYSLSTGDSDNDGIDDVFWYGGIYNGAFWGDVNGDGVVDKVIYSDKYIYLYSGDGDGTFTKKNTYSIGYNYTDYVFGDVDGDGKTDVLMYHYEDCLADEDDEELCVSDGVEVRFGGGTESNPIFEDAIRVNEGEQDEEWENGIGTADVNGDGLSDLIVSDGQTATLKVFVSTGRSFESAQSRSINYVYNNDYDNDSEDGDTPDVEFMKPTLRFADINGDGRSDFIEEGYVYYGQADGSLASATSWGGVISDFNDGDGDGDNENTRSFTMVDINGDGEEELVKYGNGYKFYIQQGSSTALRITDITDNRGETTSITYAQMTDPDVDVYTQAEPGWYEDGISMSLNPSTALVYSSSDSEGDTYFKYGGAQTSLDDGYLGFQLFASVSGRSSYSLSSGYDEDKSVIAVTYLFQEAAVAGKSYEVFKHAVSGTPSDVFSDLSFDGEDILTASYGDVDLYSSTIDPLPSYSDSAVSDYPSITTYTISAFGSDNSSIFSSNWGLLDITDDISRAVLLDTTTIYYDPDDLTSKITSNKVSNTWETIGDYGAARLTETVEVIGDFSDGYASDITSASGDYVSKKTST